MERDLDVKPTAAISGVVNNNLRERRGLENIQISGLLMFEDRQALAAPH